MELLQLQLFPQKIHKIFNKVKSSAIDGVLNIHQNASFLKV